MRAHVSPNACVRTYIPAKVDDVTEEDAGVAAWRALLLAHSGALRAIEADVHDASDIPLTWYDVLLELNSAPDRRLRMRELSDRVVLSRTRISRVVDAMATAGLVTKQPDDVDARVSWATLTADGRQALRNTAPAYLEAIEQHFTRHLSGAQLRQVANALSRVAEAHGR